MFKKWDYINQKCECHLGGSGKKKKLQSHAIKKKDVTFNFFSYIKMILIHVKRLASKS